MLTTQANELVEGYTDDEIAKLLLVIYGVDTDKNGGLDGSAKLLKLIRAVTDLIPLPHGPGNKNYLPAQRKLLSNIIGGGKTCLEV